MGTPRPAIAPNPTRDASMALRETQPHGVKNWQNPGLASRGRAGCGKQRGAARQELELDLADRAREGINETATSEKAAAGTMTATGMRPVPPILYAPSLERESQKK